MGKTLRQLLNAIKAYGELKKLYLAKYALLSEIRDDAKKNDLELNDMVNFMYVFREISKLADDMQKESDGLVQLLEKICCAIYVQRSQNTTGTAESIKASLATGTPKLHLGVKIPKASTDPEGFAALMTYLGVSAEAIKNDTVRPYWPRICEYVSQLAEQGRPLPPGIKPDATWPTYSVTIFSIQNLDELLRALKGRRAAACEKLLSTRPTHQKLKD